MGIYEPNRLIVGLLLLGLSVNLFGEGVEKSNEKDLNRRIKEKMEQFEKESRKLWES